MSLSDLYEAYGNDEAFDALRENAFFVPGMGPPEGTNPDLMLIGEAPGSLENAKRLPFQGSAGQKLSNLLYGAGIKLDVDNIFVTNVVKYWPQKAKGQTRKPTTGEIAASKPYLNSEIDIVNPKIIGLMGYIPITTIFPLHSVQNVYEVNGQIRTLAFDDQERVFMPLYHPAASFYNISKEKQVIEGFESLAKYLREL